MKWNMKGVKVIVATSTRATFTSHALRWLSKSVTLSTPISTTLVHSVQKLNGWLINHSIYHFCPMKGLKDSHYGWKLSTQPLPFMFGWCWTDTWKWIRLGGVGQCGVLCTALAAKGVDLTGSGLSSRPWEKPQISRARIWCPAFPPRFRSIP